MIKVIKPGKKEFTRVCSRCNCEFVYGLDDLDTTLVLNGVIKCPECGMELKHLDNELQLPQIPQTATGIPAYPTYPGTPNYPNWGPYFALNWGCTDPGSSSRLY